MNIFILDENPVLAAKMHCDQHVVKMILESAQILSTVVRQQRGDEVAEELQLYNTTHKNHPCTKWAASAAANVDWLYTLVAALDYQFFKKTGKHHASKAVATRAASSMIDDCGFLDSWNHHTPFIVCAPYPMSHMLDPVAAYREYYRQKNRDSFNMRWTYNTRPQWMDN